MTTPLTALVLLLQLLTQLPVRGQDSAPADPGGESWSVMTLLRYQQRLHPGMQARDVYKLLYQAAFGVEHLLTDTAGVKAFLKQELAHTDTGSGPEPLLERISPDGRMVRVNLRPLRALNFPADSLVEAMFTSAAETIADSMLFHRGWNEYVALVRYGLLPAPADLAEWTRRVADGELGPAHHSAGYVEANRPSYRVVRRDRLVPMLNNSGIP
jgi:hypothetical protein